MSQVREFFSNIYRSFVPEERTRMRRALKCWAKAGCLMITPKEPKYPWVNEDDYFSDYMGRS